LTAADDREAALSRIVELARTHGIDAAEIAAALSRPASSVESAPARSPVLTQLFAYLGVMFVFAGIAIFIAMQWGELNSPARIVATLGPGLALFGMAYAARTDPRFAKAVTPLLITAAILQPIGILVAINEYSTGGDWRYASLGTSGAMLVQQLMSFFALRRATLLFASFAFGAVFFATAMDLAGADSGLTALVTGASLTSLTASLRRGEHAVLCPFWYLIGTGVLLGGVFDLLSDTAIEPLFLGIACFMVYLSTSLKTRSMLIVATIAILGYIGYFTQQNFLDVVGWPLALIAFGLVMIGLSALAVRISHRYISPSV
jgi:hypothetical protein